MSMYTDPFDATGSGDNGDGTDDTQPKQVTLDRSHLRALEKKAAKADQADLVQRENTLLKLGVDTDSPGGKLILGNSDLPWDKPDEIKTMATAVNALRPAEPTKEETEATKTPEELAAEAAATQEAADQAKERTGVATGAVGDEGKSLEDPRKVASEETLDAMRKGATESDALGHYVNQLARAAATGDERVLVTKR